MKISIITASFNCSKTIADTCRSIETQKEKDWEHLVVDGVSSDETLTICASFPDARRKVVSGKDNGVYDAMNKGISRATGDIIGFLNADDFYESADVLGQIAEAFEDEQVDLVYGNLRYVEFEDTSKVIRDWKSEPYQRGRFLSGWMPPHPTVYARRRVFEEVGVFDPSFDLCSDWDWLYRAFELHGVRTHHIDEYLVRMRMGGVSNSSWSNVLKSNRESARAFRKHGRRVPLSFFPGKLVHRLKQFIKVGEVAR